MFASIKEIIWFAAVIPLVLEVLVAIARTARSISVDYHDYGLLQTFLLWTLFFQARPVTSRVRNHVIARPEEINQAWVIRDSFATSFSMIAVAGAIVAQIAITALSLPYQEETHWAVSASFVVSLVFGLLSVYFACIVQVTLGNLHTPAEVRKWLVTERIESKPRRSILDRLIGRRQRRSRAHETDSWESPPESQSPDDSLETLLREFRAKHIPSFHSALLLVAPVQLLNWSVAWLLVGIGIYYGLIFTKDLGDLHGQNANLAILLVYIISAAGALASLILPRLYKLTEVSDWIDAHHRKLEGLLRESRAMDERGRNTDQSSQTVRRSQELPHDQEVGSGSSSHSDRGLGEGRNAASPAGTTATKRNNDRSQAIDVARVAQSPTDQIDDHDSPQQDVAASPPGEHSAIDDFYHLDQHSQVSRMNSSDDDHVAS